mmetsp:Transcript_4587/g.10177  ORF Transcript_4587/g.10177 Transcript_4587/m.10177 type:complete len:423 (+) Transcript_4587:375-1643(+)
MEPNKSKSPLPPIVTLGNLSTINLATLTKVIFELPPTSLPGEVANKELTSFLGGASLHVGGIVGTLVVEPTAAVTVVGTSASATLLAILTDKDGTSVEFRVLEFTDGTLGFMGLLVENDSAAFGAAIASFEDVGLVNVTSGTHVILQVLPASLIRQVTNIHTQTSPTMVSPSTTTSTLLKSSTSMSSASLLTILPHKDHPSLQLGICQLSDRLLRPSSGSELHNTTSLGATIVISHDLRVGNISNCTHVIFEILPSHIPGKISDVNTLGLSVLVASAPSSASTTATRSLLPILPHKNLPPRQLTVIQLLHSPRSLLGGRILHNPTPLRPSIVSLHNVRSEDISTCLHMIFEITPSRTPREVAHVHTAVLGGRSSIGSDVGGLVLLGVGGGMTTSVLRGRILRDLRTGFFSLARVGGGIVGSG